MIEGGAPLVCDVKYKDKPNRADINQMATYALVYRTKTVVMVHQNPPSAPKGLSLTGTINDVDIWSYAIDLDAANLLQEEAAIAKALFGLLS